MDTDTSSSDTDTSDSETSDTEMQQTEGGPVVSKPIVAVPAIATTVVPLVPPPPPPPDDSVPTEMITDPTGRMQRMGGGMFLGQTTGKNTSRSTTATPAIAAAAPPIPRPPPPPQQRATTMEPLTIAALQERLCDAIIMGELAQIDLCMSLVHWAGARDKIVPTRIPLTSSQKVTTSPYIHAMSGDQQTRSATIRHLIKRGFEINAMSILPEANDIPLWVAFQSKIDIDTFIAMLAAGANPNVIVRTPLTNDKYPRGIGMAALVAIDDRLTQYTTALLVAGASITVDDYRAICVLAPANDFTNPDSEMWAVAFICNVPGFARGEHEQLTLHEELTLSLYGRDIVKLCTRVRRAIRAVTGLNIHLPGVLSQCATHSRCALATEFIIEALDVVPPLPTTN